MNETEITKQISTLEHQLSIAVGFIIEKCTCKLWNKDHPDYLQCKSCVTICNINALGAKQ